MMKTSTAERTTSVGRTKLKRRKPTLHIPSILENWLKEHYVSSEDGNITKASIYSRYTVFCDEHNLASKTQNIFGKMLKKLFPNVQSRRLGPAGKLVAHYSGIARRAGEELIEGEESEEGLAENGDMDNSPPVLSKNKIRRPMAIEKEHKHKLTSDQNDHFGSSSFTQHQRHQQPHIHQLEDEADSESLEEQESSLGGTSCCESPWACPPDWVLDELVPPIERCDHAIAATLVDDCNGYESPFSCGYGCAPNATPSLIPQATSAELSSVFSDSRSPLHVLFDSLRSADADKEEEEEEEEEDDDSAYSFAHNQLPSRGLKRTVDQRDIINAAVMSHAEKRRRLLAPLNGQISEYQMARFNMYQQYIGLYERRGYPFVTLPHCVFEEDSLRRLLRKRENYSMPAMFTQFALYLGSVQAGDFTRAKDFFMNSRDNMADMYDTMDLDVATVLLHMAYGVMYFAPSPDTAINLLAAAMSICEATNARDTRLYRQCISIEAWLCKGECVAPIRRDPKGLLCKPVGQWPDIALPRSGASAGRPMDKMDAQILARDIVGLMVNVSFALQLASAEDSPFRGEIPAIAERLAYCYTSLCSLESSLSLSEDITFLCKFWILSLLANIELALGATDKALPHAYIALELLENRIGNAVPIGVELHIDGVANVFFHANQPEALCRLLQAMQRSMGKLVLIENLVSRWHSLMASSGMKLTLTDGNSSAPSTSDASLISSSPSSVESLCSELCTSEPCSDPSSPDIQMPTVFSPSTFFSGTQVVDSAH